MWETQQSGSHRATWLLPMAASWGLVWSGRSCGDGAWISAAHLGVVTHQTPSHLVEPKARGPGYGSYSAREGEEAGQLPLAFSHSFSPCISPPTSLLHLLWRKTESMKSLFLRSRSGRQSQQTLCSPLLRITSKLQLNYKQPSWRIP